MPLIFPLGLSPPTVRASPEQTLRCLASKTAPPPPSGRAGASEYLAKMESSAAPPVGAAPGSGPEPWPGKGAEAGGVGGQSWGNRISRLCDLP